MCMYRSAACIYCREVVGVVYTGRVYTEGVYGVGVHGWVYTVGGSSPSLLPFPHGKPVLEAFYSVLCKRVYNAALRIMPR